jgi:endonuclease/exonuclease/phosphatase family metal-dependent hydrolase
MRTRSLGAAALLPVAALSIVALFGFEHARFFASGVAVALVDLRGVPSLWAVLIMAVVAGLTLAGVPVVPGASRPALVLGVSVAVILRLLLQLTTAPLAGLVASSAGIVVSVLVIGMAAGAYGGRVVGTSLLLGAGLDVAVMGGRHTLDLTRSNTLGATVGVVLLGVAAVVAVWSEAEAGGQRRYGVAVPASALFLVGPWMASHLLLTGNIGVIATLSEGPLALAAAAALVGSIGALAWSSPERSGSVPALAGGIAAISLMFAVRADGVLVLVLVALVGMTAGATLTGALERESNASPVRAGWGLSSGLLVGFLVAAAVESALATPWGSRPDGWYLVLALALLGGGVVANTHRGAESASWYVPALVAVALLAVPGWLWATDGQEGSDQPGPVATAEPENPEIVVVTYNLSHGFDPRGTLNLEAMTAALRETAWQILALQEVSRGRLRDGGLDMVAWLERDLGIELSWQPSGSRFSGNALAATIPVTVGEPILLDEERAGAAVVDAMVEVPGMVEPIRVFVVGMEAAQPGLAAALIDRWDRAPFTVVVGDFGPPMDEASGDEMRAVLDAGFYDPAALVAGSPATYPSDVPVEQRDVILISRDLSLNAVRIVESTASDHRPVLVRVLVVPQESAE